MTKDQHRSVRDILLTQCGVVCVSRGARQSTDETVRAVELEFANLGYVMTSRLRERLTCCAPSALSGFRQWTIEALRAHIGADQKHEPLFRHFPDGVPDNTEELWWKKVLVHYVQGEELPCLFCGHVGTTHVLNPCRHVICDQCFDGSNYSACPVCEHHVDRSSPFFQPPPAREPARERTTFKLIDLAENEAEEVRGLFVSLCLRTQALSPVDRQALTVILQECNADVLGWLPVKIPVRENIAVVFGTLFQELDASVVLPIARAYMTVATDVLRFIAVLSGTDGSLLPETIFKTVERESPSRRFWGQIAERFGIKQSGPMRISVNVPLRVHRFKTAKLPRPLRRALLSLLEGFNFDRLVEDMLRHRSYWVWIGEFLHPHEYAARFPNTARAFQIVRKKDPNGITAPKFHGWHSRVERALIHRDARDLLAVLSERPGEFARRLDVALRVAGEDAAAVELVIEAFAHHAPSLATPVLVTLGSLIPTRNARAPARIFWPKGRIALGVSSVDQRTVLPERAITTVVGVVKAELLRRFAEKQSFADGLVDAQLKTITVPFNERTASVAAITIPRGSRLPVQLEKTARLFLHWRQPSGQRNTTDLDLSIALYDSQWRYQNVCSYYALKVTNSEHEVIAKSSGDMRDAPWPNGATEFVDLDCQKATAMGARYAVMVINAFAGLSFSQLDRAFAGLMLRDDPGGDHFDPVTVQLKFALDGTNGVFMPLVLDLRDNVLHWLDVQTRGQLAMNNVETSKGDIADVCPKLMTYFGSGVRPSMYDLALLHAAARCQRVTIRDRGLRQFVRMSNETREAFFERIVHGLPDLELPAATFDDAPIFAALYSGDLTLPEGSCSYVLIRERTKPTIAASDLLS